MRFTISTKGELKEHYKVDHRGTRFKCDRCNYEGTQKTNLGRHMEAEHGTEPAQGKCTECDFTTSTKGELKENYKVDHGGTRFKCDKCSYEGTQKDKLGRHMEAEHGTWNMV